MDLLLIFICVSPNLSFELRFEHDHKERLLEGKRRPFILISQIIVIVLFLIILQGDKEI